ncbi:MAG TPA: protein kinase, partial [bacterium]|nr:protein kinase [bacterium]
MPHDRWNNPAAPVSAPKRSAEIQIKLEGKRVNDWVVGDYVTEGAFGLVYRAQHHATGEPAALKIMKPEMVTLRRLERFQREALVLGRLQHPNIVRSLESGRAEVV